MNTREQHESDAGRPEGPPRRRRKWRLAAFLSVAGVVVLGLAGVGTLLVLFATGNPALSQRVVSTLNDAIGTDSTRFACDRVRATMFRGARLDHPRVLVRTVDGEITWAEAASVRVDYDLFRLLFSRRRDLRVVVVEPRFALIHDRRGDIVMPRFAPAPPRRASSNETRVSVVIQNGGFSIDREGIRFGKISGSGDLTVGGPGASLMIRDLSGSSETPGRPGRLAISGLIAVEGGTLRADPFDVSIASSNLSASVAWDLRKARVVEGTLRLHPLNVQEFFHAFQIASGEGLLTGEIGITGTPSAGDAWVCLGGNYAGETIDTLLFKAHSRPGAIEINDLKFRVRDAEVTGKGVFSTRGALSADLGFRGLNPALLPWWKPAKPAPEGMLSGRARIEARRARPRPEATVAVTFDPGHLGPVTIDRGFVRAQLARDGTTTIDSAWVEVPGARVAAKGTLGTGGAIQADVRGDVSDLAQLNTFMKPLDAESGTGHIVGQVSGTLEAPQFHARVEAHRARFRNGIGCDTLEVRVQGAMKPALDLTAQIAARGMSASGRSLGNAEVVLAGGQTLRIERYRQALGDTVLALQGVIQFAADGTRARIDTLSLTAGTHHITNRDPLDLEILHEHFRASHLTLDLGPGTLEANVDWNPGKGTIDARGLIGGLDLSRLREIQPRDSEISGMVSGEFLASGPIANPDLSLRLDVLRPGVGAIVGDSLVVGLDYAPGVLSVTRASWSAGESRLELSGSLRPAFTLEEWWRALAKKDRGWAEHVTLALSASADSFDLQRIAPADSSLATLHGVATVRARVSGTCADPVIEIDGHVPSISYRGVDGEIVAASLNYRDRVLRMDPLQVRQGKSVSEVKGQLPIDLSLYGSKHVIEDGPISLSVNMPDANLSLVPLLVPDIAASSGKVTLTAEVRGTPRNPNVTGAVQIRDGRLRLAGRDEVLTDISLEATFDQERVTITKADAKQGKKGKLEMTGYWRWPTEAQPPWQPAAVGPRGEYKFHVKATEMTATDRETYYLRFTGDLDIVNAINPVGAPVPYITGNVVLTKGELTMDLSKPPDDPSPPLPVLYNVKAEIPGNLFYRTLDAEIEFSSEDLIFKNEGKGDLALGILTVEGGKYYIMTRQFRNLSGTINCNNPDKIDPEVNITAETTIPGSQGEQKVYLALTDRVSRLKVRVYDDAGTPPNDLWKALAFGAFAPGGSTDITQGNGTATQENAAGVAVPITNYLFQNVERWIGGTGFIDTIDLRSSANTGGSTTSAAGPISVVGVGKYVTPEVYLKYTRDFSANSEEQINADYRVTRSLILKGQQIRRPTGQDRPQQEYNVDLKVRLEY